MNRKESMWQAWSEDKQAVFHAGFYRSTNGKSMSYRPLIRVSGRCNFYQYYFYQYYFYQYYSKISFDTEKLNRKHWEVFAPLSFIPNKEEFSFSLFIDIHDWIEAKHDCKPFSAAAESPDAKCSLKLHHILHKYINIPLIREYPSNMTSKVWH